MHIHYHQVKILHQWSADEGRLLNGAVLVEFTLQDDTIGDLPQSSRLVEYVSLDIEHRLDEAYKNQKLAQHACEQVRHYFEGDGARENLFAEGPTRPSPEALSPTQEAELQAELRSIEQEFDTIGRPASDEPLILTEKHAASF